MESARDGCSFFLARLRSEVDRLLAVTYPGHHKGPKKWLSIVGGVLDTAEGYLTSAADSALTSDQKSALLRDAERLGNNAYELLEHMNGADATEIPHQIVRPFQRWVDGVGITNTVFFRADHVPNYELATIDLRSFIRNINNPSQTLIDARDAVDWPFRRVTVPSHAMGMLPHFAIVAHELGHAIQDNIKIDLTPHHQVDADSLHRTELRLTAAGTTFRPEHRLRRTKIAVSWINELKSDAVGYWIAGPACFFALGAFLELAGQGWGLGATHPPSELRRRLLFDRLSEGGPSYADVFEKHTRLRFPADINSPHVDSLPAADLLFAALSNKIGFVDAAICVELIPLVEALGRDIYDAAKGLLTATNARMIYDPIKLDEDLEVHLSPLCGLVPPIEKRVAGVPSACSLATILNVGWAALLTKLPDFPAGRAPPGRDVRAHKMEKLHELLLKAVELSDARQTWEET